MNNKLIDMHIHILPAVDDGSKNIEETRAMLEQAYNSGIRTIVATPHCSIGDDEVERAGRIRKAYEEACSICQEIADENGDEDFRLLLGSEVFCTPSIAMSITSMIKEGIAFSINGGRHVLVELNYSSSLKEALLIVRHISDAGYIPVFAHIERYENIFKSTASIKELISRGAVIQMNAGRFVTPKNWREMFSRTRRRCYKLLDEGLIHVIGSDSHTSKRGNNLAEAFENIKKALGDEKAQQLMRNAERIILNEEIVYARDK